MKECLMNKYTYSISNENKEACKAGQLIQAAKLPTKEETNPFTDNTTLLILEHYRTNHFNKLKHHINRLLEI